MVCVRVSAGVSLCEWCACGLSWLHGVSVWCLRARVCECSYAVYGCGLCACVCAGACGVCLCVKDLLKDLLRIQEQIPA